MGSLLLLPYTAEREISIPSAEYRYRGQNASEIWIGVQQDRVGSFVTSLPAAFRSLVRTMEKACH